MLEASSVSASSDRPEVLHLEGGVAYRIVVGVSLVTGELVEFHEPVEPRCSVRPKGGRPWA